MKKLYESSIKQKYHRDNIKIKHRNRILTLSGGDCIDIQDFIDKGIADANTDIFIIERDESLIDKINRNLNYKVKNNKIKSYEIINQNFEDINFSYYESFDLCNLDFTGTLNYNIIKKISEIKFSKNAGLYVNFCLRNSNKNNFLIHFENILNNDHYYLARSIMDKVKFFNYEKTSRTSYANSKIAYDKYDWVTFISLYVALREYEFELGKPIRYRSKTLPMRLFSFENINKTNEISYPSISSIYENKTPILSITNYKQKINNNLPNDNITKQIIYAFSNGHNGQINYLFNHLMLKKQEAFLNNKNPNNTIGAYYASVIKSIDPLFKMKVKNFFQRIKHEPIPEMKKQNVKSCQISSNSPCSLVSR